MLNCSMSSVHHEPVPVDPVKCIHGLTSCGKADGCCLIHPPKYNYWHPDNARLNHPRIRKDGSEKYSEFKLE